MMASTKSKLNPLAAEFVPGSTHAAAATVAALPAAASEASQHQEPGAAAAVLFDIMELPMEMLSCIMLSLSGCGHDLCSCLLASQQLQSAVRAAPVTYSLTEQQQQLLSNPANSCKLDALVHALTKYMPAMVSCSLSMSPLEPGHIASLAAGLQHLAVLDLSGCKKLQPGVTKLLQQRGMLPHLQCINMQRCFQLTEACLTDLVAQSCGATAAACSSSAACSRSGDSSAAACRNVGGGRDVGDSAGSGSSSSLQCIALSHLNLVDWPFQSADSGAGGRASAAENTAADEAETAQATKFWQRLEGVVRAALLRVPSRFDLAPLQLQFGAASAVAASSGSLRAVVLNNCSNLSVEGLLALAAACPKLELLMLGGSTLKASWDCATAAAAHLVSEAAGTSAAAAAAAGEAAAAPEGAGIYVPPRVAAASGSAGAQSAAGSVAASLPAALQQLASMLELPSVLPWEVLSACCTHQDGLACGQRPCSCCRGAEYSSNAADAAAVGAGGMAKVRSQLHRNEPSAAAVAAARGHALALTYAAALLPELKAIEVTFMAPAVAGWLRVAMHRLQQIKGANGGCAAGMETGSMPSMSGLYRSCSSDSSSSSGGGDCEEEVCRLGDGLQRATSAGSNSSSSSSSSGSYPRVWEFTCIASVHDAVQMLQDSKRNSMHVVRIGSTSSSSSSSSNDDLNPACLETAVRCAANCSSRGRSTPMHTAAERGCAQHVQVLLQAGAAAAARDTSGASPLFVAAEAGRAAAVEALLCAGADPLVGNTAGETALYIAALRGHLPVVEVLLRHLSAAGVDWMQEGLYGDAWTPLMAAAVANRVDVALCLLRAANGFTAASSKLQQQLGNTQQLDSRDIPGLAGLHSSGSACRNNTNSSGARYQDHAHAYHQQRQRSAADVSRGGAGAAGVERLLAAENRYGQTALHIAARKGCRELLQLLLCYGAVRVAGQVVDTAGDTWADVARRHGHGVALRELLQQC